MPAKPEKTIPKKTTSSVLEDFFQRPEDLVTSFVKIRKSVKDEILKIKKKEKKSIYELTEASYLRLIEWYNSPDARSTKTLMLDSKTAGKGPGLLDQFFGTQEELGEVFARVKRSTKRQICEIAAKEDRTIYEVTEVAYILLVDWYRKNRAP